MPSLDPRINRLGLTDSTAQVSENEFWHTYEVFHQDRRGKHHIHVGSVHAPDHELALVFAKEQYARRKKCANMWVIKTSDIFAFNLKDEDMFETTPEKLHREAGGYRVREKIAEFQKRNSSK